jgi:hypothetical protein
MNAILLEITIISVMSLAFSVIFYFFLLLIG